MLCVGFLIYCVFRGQDAAFPWDQFFGQWVKWDANSYIRIPNGYRAMIENGDYVMLVFFPFYSWIIKIFNWVIPNINAAALTVSSLCYSAGCVFMYKLCLIDYPRESAKKAVTLISAFPFAFFFGSIMSESTFFLTSVITLYCIRKHNWAAAGIAGMCAALSRSAGVFLIFPATVEFIEEYKILANLKKPKRVFSDILKKWSFLLLLPLGTCIYLYINYKTAGSPFEFLRLEEKYWSQTTRPFFKTIGYIWTVITSSSTNVSTKFTAFVPGLTLPLIMYAVLICGLKKTRSMHLTWLIIYLVVNTSMSWPLSIGRYMLCAVPAFIIAGDLLRERNKAFTAVTFASCVLMGIYYTAYLIDKQVM